MTRPYLLWWATVVFGSSRVTEAFSPGTWKMRVVTVRKSSSVASHEMVPNNNNRKKHPFFQIFQEEEDLNDEDDWDMMPVQNSQGIFEVGDKLEFSTLLHHESIVVCKFYAPHCRACKALAPKFLQVKAACDDGDAPVAFARVSSFHTKDLLRELNIQALPTIQCYVKGKLEMSGTYLPGQMAEFSKELEDLVERSKHVPKIETPDSSPPREIIDDYIKFVEGRRKTSAHKARKN